jgi:hypothetical protein
MTTETRTLTAQEQGADATRRLRAVLGLGELSSAALKLLSTAVAQTAAEEAQRNPSFAARLRAAHESLTQQVKAPKKRSSRPAAVDLVPIGYVDMSDYDPFGPLDPYLLLKLYGHHQLALALSRHPLPKLKEALAMVEARNPGIKPSSRSSKNAIIEYIVTYIGS